VSWRVYGWENAELRLIFDRVLAMVAGMPILFTIALLDKQRKRAGGSA